MAGTWMGAEEDLRRYVAEINLARLAWLFDVTAAHIERVIGEA